MIQAQKETATQENPWTKNADMLGFESIGNSFTNLIQSLNTSKVISIEAGFGRGKTFFRTAWADQLRQQGEVVVEVDVLKSDHSGDPVITFLGALVEALPRDKKGRLENAMASAKKFGAMGARAAARIAFRSGADEMINIVASTAIDKLDDFDALDEVISELGEGMSKAAGQMIASQMAAEKVRKKEMPEQLEALRKSLTKGSENDRVIIIIDELDRCHPDYALSVLESMKLVFCQSGYVFCLMVNAEYLERLAKHRFGTTVGDERYLDKFVDIRLRLEPNAEKRKEAIEHLCSQLHIKTRFDDRLENHEFSMARAAELAGSIVLEKNVSMRKAESILFKVEMTLRCYSDQPIDPSLLVFLAFDEAVEGEIRQELLERTTITPEMGEQKMEAEERNNEFGASKRERGPFHDNMNDEVRNIVPELVGLPRERYNLPNGMDCHPWELVYKYLAPTYIPTHREMLNAVAQFVVPDSTG